MDDTNQSDGALSEMYSRARLKNNCTRGKGQSCAGLIMHDGWKMSSDYPWK